MDIGYIYFSGLIILQTVKILKKWVQREISSPVISKNIVKFSVMDLEFSKKKNYFKILVKFVFFNVY